MNSAESKQFTGTISLYDIINHRRLSKPTQRQPVFLQRNIRQVLDDYERALNSLKPQLPAAQSTPTTTKTGMKPRLATTRTLPSEKLLAGALHRPPRILTVYPRRLLKRGSNLVGRAEALQVTAVRTGSSEGPSWLPIPDQFRIRCSISCRISMGDSEHSRTLYTDTRLAQLVGTKDDKGDWNFVIDMEQPFTIMESQIFGTHLTSRNANSGKRWKKAVFKDGILGIGVSFFNPDDADRVLSEIDPDFDSKHELSPEHTELRATWKKLPDCPGRLLTLRRYQNGHGPKSKKLEHSLETDVNWSPEPQMDMTPLAMCNHSIRLSQNPSRPQQAETSPEPPECRIRYIFSDSKQMVETTFCCVFCPECLPHPTFDRLHFHYLTCHDHFAFRVSVPKNYCSSLCVREVEIELATPKYDRASVNVPDTRELCLIKPDRLFDLRQYLLEGGDSSWASGRPIDPKIARLLRPTLVGSPRASGQSPNGRLESVSTDGQSGADSTLKRARPPHEVPDLRTRKRKKFEVPYIPDVAIFRSLSKREVKPGEVVSESDDDPDDSSQWLKHSTEDFPQLSGAAREFAIMFDGHMYKERISADRHVCEAVVRFTRSHAEHLRRPHLLQELRNKVAELQGTGLISQEYIDFCVGFVTKGQQANGGGAENPVTDANSMEDVQPVINGTGNAQPTRSSERPTTKIDNAVKQESAASAADTPVSASQKVHNRMDVIMIDDSDEEAEAGAEVSLEVPKSGIQPELSSQPTITGNPLVKEQVYHAPQACNCGELAIGVRGVISCANLVGFPYKILVSMSYTDFI